MIDASVSHTSLGFTAAAQERPDLCVRSNSRAACEVNPRQEPRSLTANQRYGSDASVDGERALSFPTWSTALTA